MRASYNWVGLWAGKWMWFYVVLWIAVIGWRGGGARELHSRNITIPCRLPAIGIISVPLSYVLLERRKLGPHAPISAWPVPAIRDAFGDDTGCIAAVRAAERKRYLETFVFFVVPLIATGAEWDTEKLTALRLLLVCALALLVATRGDPAGVRMAGCDRRIYSVLCVPRNCRDSELPGDTLPKN